MNRATRSADRGPGASGEVASVTLRPARPADAIAVAAVHAASVMGERGRGDYDDRQIDSWASRHTPEQLARRMSTRVFVVAETGDDLVAYGQLDVASGVLRSLHVVPEWQRKGVGRKVAEDLLAAARAAGLSTVALDASLNAVGFYRSLGFDELARLDHPLADASSLTCVRMAKRLDSAGEPAPTGGPAPAGRDPIAP